MLKNEILYELVGEEKRFGGRSNRPSERDAGAKKAEGCQDWATAAREGERKTGSCKGEGQVYHAETYEWLDNCSFHNKKNKIKGLKALCVLFLKLCLYVLNLDHHLAY